MTVIIDRRMSRSGKGSEGLTNSQPHPDKSGFLTLLKPMQDALAQDWKVRLQPIIDVYREYLREAGYIDFSEAALVIQNSSKFFCKRVDIMYDWVRKFCFSLCGDDPSQNNDENQKNVPNIVRKHKKDPLAKEKFMRMGYISTKNYRRFDIDKLKGIDLFIPFLTFNSKCNIKSGTSISIYQYPNEEMGYKDEFRINGKLLSNGMVVKEYKLSNEEVPQVIDDEEAVDEYMDVGDDLMDRSMDIEDAPCDIPPVNDGTDHLSLAEPGNMGDSFRGPSPLPQIPDMKDNDPDVEPCPRPLRSSARLIHRKIKEGMCISLPPKVVEKLDEDPKSYKKKRVPDKKPFEELRITASKILHGEPESMVEFKLRKRADTKLKLPLPMITNIEEDPEVENAPFDDRDDHSDIFNNSIGRLDDDEDIPQSVPCNFDEAPDLNLEKAFEEACRPVLKRKQEDALTMQQRVRDWHTKMGPSLVTAEKRSKFDVHEYGTKIIDQFASIGETKSFSDICHVTDKKDVCRFALSTLMLANTYNVEISHSQPGELISDCVQLKLINTVRHHEELDANIGEAAGAAR